MTHQSRRGFSFSIELLVNLTFWQRRDSEVGWGKKVLTRCGGVVLSAVKQRWSERRLPQRACRRHRRHRRRRRRSICQRCVGLMSTRPRHPSSCPAAAHRAGHEPPWRHASADGRKTNDRMSAQVLTPSQQYPQSPASSFCHVAITVLDYCFCQLFVIITSYKSNNVRSNMHIPYLRYRVSVR